jgi:lysophospholipase L1-like esterase
VEDLNASDGLHPSGKMYTLWVDIIYPGVKVMLEN